MRDTAARAATPTIIDCDGAGRYPGDIEAAVYFCCLEALQNAAKHAGDGAHVRIALNERDSVLRFEVADDGAGFDARRDGGATAGLQNMVDRIGALGGELEINSELGRGTTVTGTVPLAAARASPLGLD